MLAKAKDIVSRLPILGYCMHWVSDILRLPLIRLDLERESRRLQEIERQNHDGVMALGRRLQEIERQNHDGIAALRRSFDDAVTQLDVLYTRIMSTDGTQLQGEGYLAGAEFRADVLKRLWATDRRLGEIERQIRKREIVS